MEKWRGDVIGPWAGVQFNDLSGRNWTRQWPVSEAEVPEHIRGSTRDHGFSDKGFAPTAVTSSGSGRVSPLRSASGLRTRPEANPRAVRQRRLALLPGNRILEVAPRPASRCPTTRNASGDAIDGSVTASIRVISRFGPLQAGREVRRLTTPGNRAALPSPGAGFAHPVAGISECPARTRRGQLRTSATRTQALTERVKAAAATDSILGARFDRARIPRSSRCAAMGVLRSCVTVERAHRRIISLGRTNRHLSGGAASAVAPGRNREGGNHSPSTTAGGDGSLLPWTRRHRCSHRPGCVTVHWRASPRQDHRAPQLAGDHGRARRSTRGAGDLVRDHRNRANAHPRRGNP